MCKIKVASIYFLAFLAVSSCTKHNDSPERALEEYVSTGFSAKSLEDKKKLLSLSTGEAYDELDKISDKDFLDRFGQSKLRFVSFKTRDLRKENNGNVSLIYELTFEDHSSGAPSLVTNKKIAFLVQDEKTHEWKVKSTTNIKSLIERKEPLAVTPSP